MSGFLLDVNVLVALMWPAHEAHQRVQQWFGRKSGEGWATCPFTQAGFVRIVTNPAFSHDAVTPQEAVKSLEAHLRNPYHRFWPDEVGYAEAVQPLARRLTGHQQVTDGYLLGLAIHKRGKLATMDRTILALLSEKALERDSVTII